MSLRWIVSLIVKERFLTEYRHGKWELKSPDLPLSYLVFLDNVNLVINALVIPYMYCDLH